MSSNINNLNPLLNPALTTSQSGDATAQGAPDASAAAGSVGAGAMGGPGGASALQGVQVPNAYQAVGALGDQQTAQAPKSSVLSTPPPVIGSTLASNRSDLQSGQQKLQDLNQFGHPANAAMIAAMENGIGSTTGQGSLLQGTQAHEIINNAAGANLNESSTNFADASTQLKEKQDGNDLLMQAQAAAKSDDSKKCHGHHQAQNQLADQLSMQMGISKKDALNLLKALAPEGGQTSTLSTSQAQVMASGMATLKQLRASGQGSSERATALQSQLEDAAKQSGAENPGFLKKLTHDVLGKNTTATAAANMQKDVGGLATTMGWSSSTPSAGGQQAFPVSTSAAAVSPEQTPTGAPMAAPSSASAPSGVPAASAGTQASGGATNLPTPSAASVNPAPAVPADAQSASTPSSVSQPPPGA